MQVSPLAYLRLQLNQIRFLETLLANCFVSSGSRDDFQILMVTPLPRETDHKNLKHILMHIQEGFELCYQYLVLKHVLLCITNIDIFLSL